MRGVAMFWRAVRRVFRKQKPKVMMTLPLKLERAIRTVPFTSDIGEIHGFESDSTEDSQ